MLLLLEPPELGMDHASTMQGASAGGERIMGTPICDWLSNGLESAEFDERDLDEGVTL